ncbi:FeoB-associated Cys-rich membrane protein [Paenibacillus polymyxa]|uniref:FeoB-associated Cys-rich membrane protein n=1 Tax=Paenibacillus polymyxa TaxID=1406 RepID=UPI0003200CD3|nr:FeoB-associated Cys-rich membrane protein [Paenibacillus polymyxa]MBE7900324.1 FeoB-associated Cys-rich membrane protein [Paenibacillus polymyxa]MCC3260114.1 FeoB-associated Cys-rich membrane protein [Paenibacillus polymyxa]MCJ1220606.1 FeoB-associated Cys-rich membrane protein [Paenibacillus polymyxa]QDA27678.1 FeoB-associated Cys-rich membrane protein [Paenibacillus polymyxa]QPK53441.1 FeoB-associated Cys-rich membrane protein [Paenibacillus polymyxa]
MINVIILLAILGYSAWVLVRFLRKSSQGACAGCSSSKSCPGCAVSSVNEGHAKMKKSV